MKSLLLQVPQEISYLTNYGILGVFAILMIGVIYFMGKQFFVWHKKNELRIQELEKRHDQYMTEDRVRLIDTVNSNNNVIENNTAMMKKLLNLVEKLEKTN
jgi:predicted membrane channel-forming protein YqfA (hemolysin III family)